MQAVNTLPADWRDYRPSADAFADRIVLVTGASAGIGRAVARALVTAGATVILHGRSEKALEALYQELKPLGPEPAVAVLDLERAQGPQYQALTDEIEKRYGRLDGLLHNASILGDRSPIEHYDIGVWQRVMLVNLTAPFILTRCLLPMLKAAQDASLLFTTSSVGRKRLLGSVCRVKGGDRKPRASALRRAREHRDPRQHGQSRRNEDGHAKAGISSRGRGKAHGS
jgi:NAD(P)-dependent dehydrogenase (short-subunit alcohol dehydrogenase family)